MKTIANKAICLSGRNFNYAVRYSRKAKFVSLSVSSHQGLVVVVPYRLRETTIPVESLLQSKARWIIRKIDHVAQRRTTFPAQSFVHGSKLQFIGRELTLDVIVVDPQPARVCVDGSALRIQLSKVASEPEVKQLVVGWYRRMAKHLIPNRVEELNRRIGFRYTTITIRDQGSRWGSCSRRRTLSFNWRLLLLPPQVMDYLIFHELAHLQEMNHSKKFWSLLSTMDPSFRESELWLKQSGARLLW